jgi:hypothetical protein
MDKETAEMLGLPYDPALDEEETDEEVQAEEDAQADEEPEAGGLSYIPARVRREYEQSLKAYEGSYQNQINQIQKAKDLLLSQPTELSRSQYLQQLGSVLTAPRKSTDPRFYERRNLFTFLRDVGELGSAKKAAEEKAKLEQQQKLLQLDEMAAKYGQQRDLDRLKLATQLMGKYKPTAAAKDPDEITRLQERKRQLVEQRSTLDPRDPSYLSFGQEIQQLDKRIAYLGGEKGKEGGMDFTPGEKAVDQQIAKEYASWITGGGAQAASRINKINDVINRIEEGEDLSGPVVGFTLEKLPGIASVVYPGAQDAKDVVESVVQTDLRAVLGGQFAASENAALVRRAYNPSLGEEKNKKRLQLLLLQMQKVADEKNRTMNFFEANGTIKGFKYTPYTYNDFLTYDQLKRLDEGESPESIAGSITPSGDGGKPKAGESKPAGGGKPAGGKPNEPKKKYKKRIKRGDSFIEIEVEE